VISPTQRPLPVNTQHSQQRYFHDPGGIQTHNLWRRAAAGTGWRTSIGWKIVRFQSWNRYAAEDVSIDSNGTDITTGHGKSAFICVYVIARRVRNLIWEVRSSKRSDSPEGKWKWSKLSKVQLNKGALIQELDTQNTNWIRTMRTNKMPYLLFRIYSNWYISCMTHTNCATYRVVPPDDEH